MEIMVYVVDDSSLVRRRLIEMLSEIPGVRIAGESGDPDEALDAIRKLSPDAVVLDIQLPRRSGIELARDIKRENPMTVVIILTNYAYPQYRRESKKAGADHFLNKVHEFEQVGHLLRQMGR